MTRLQSEWQRLYLPISSAACAASVAAPDLITPDGRTRALMLALSRPADWASLSVVWRSVQSDLALPAPGIAVSGVDGYQLWFSLAEPVPVQEARGFLEALCTRHLGHIPSSRRDLLPGGSPQAVDAAEPGGCLPPRQAAPDQWAAFVAPDLAPMFGDTPWVDIPPGLDGQAELLAGLRSITPAQWREALEQLEAAPASAPPPKADPVPRTATALKAPARAEDDPRRFLLDVMNDATAPLALRIEAAKSLLPHVPAAPDES